MCLVLRGWYPPRSTFSPCDIMAPRPTSGKEWLKIDNGLKASRPLPPPPQKKTHTVLRGLTDIWALLAQLILCCMYIYMAWNGYKLCLNFFYVRLHIKRNSYFWLWDGESCHGDVLICIIHYYYSYCHGVEGPWWRLDLIWMNQYIKIINFL